MDKRCGTCKWWDADLENGRRVGSCGWIHYAPFPESMLGVSRTILASSLMLSTEGTNCPTWEARHE